MKIVNGRLVLSGESVFVVAEMSGNHGGNLDKAKEIIRIAKRSGADAVKLQTYKPETITLDSDKEDFLIPESDPWYYKKTLFNLYREAYTPWEWHQELFNEAKRNNILLFSSPFDTTAVDLLEDLGNPIYKIASPEVTDIPLLERIANTKKPVILSTGLAELSDLDLAVSTLRNNGCLDLVLLKCTASYPAPEENMNLRTIPDLQDRYDCIAGLSDHTLGIGIPLAAVALGARVIEKHFVLSKDDNTVDAFFSLDPSELSLMVHEIRKIEKALGRIDYTVPGNVENKFNARRSLYVSKSIKKGELITENNIKSVRPAHGLHPKYYKDILGKSVSRDLDCGDRLTWDSINK
jgi:pseudaminic acid synthase